MLPQVLSGMDPDASPYDLVAAVSGDRSAEHRRAGLARLLFRGHDADRPVRELSGGERVRAALAVALLSSPAPRLLVLDEPTNNVDIPTRDHLAEALSGFRGASSSSVTTRGSSTRSGSPGRSTSTRSDRGPHPRPLGTRNPSLGTWNP